MSCIEGKSVKSYPSLGCINFKIDGRKYAITNAAEACKPNVLLNASTEMPNAKAISIDTKILSSNGSIKIITGYTIGFRYSLISILLTAMPCIKTTSKK